MEQGPMSSARDFSFNFQYPMDLTFHNLISGCWDLQTRCCENNIFHGTECQYLKKMHEKSFEGSVLLANLNLRHFILHNVDSRQ